MREVEIIPEVYGELVFYHWVYISIHYIKVDGVENNY